MIFEKIIDEGDWKKWFLTQLGLVSTGLIILCIMVLFIVCVKNFSLNDTDELNRMLDSNTRITVTLKDNKIHVQGCREIAGVTEKMTYRKALSRYYTHCNFCFDEDD